MSRIQLPTVRSRQLTAGAAVARAVELPRWGLVIAAWAISPVAG